MGKPLPHHVVPPRPWASAPRHPHGASCRAVCCPCYTPGLELWACPVLHQVLSLAAPPAHSRSTKHFGLMVPGRDQGAQRPLPRAGRGQESETPAGSFPNPGPHFSICRMGLICRQHGGPGRACPVPGPKVGRGRALDSTLDSAPFPRPPQLASLTCPCVQSTNCTTDQNKNKKPASWWSGWGEGISWEVGIPA